jgi:hypothetical protein
LDLISNEGVTRVRRGGVTPDTRFPFRYSFAFNGGNR